jgi:hypothetical protein
MSLRRNTSFGTLVAVAAMAVALPAGAGAAALAVVGLASGTASVPRARIPAVTDMPVAASITEARGAVKPGATVAFQRTSSRVRLPAPLGRPARGGGR